MIKETITAYVKDNPLRKNKPSTGPFITISRQFGCSGYELAEILTAKLNDICESDLWKVYRKDILHKLAAESGFSVEAIEKAKTERTGLLRDIFKNFRVNAAPDAYQVRSQIAAIVRRLATDGYAVIVGQGGAATTSEIKNGLSVRIEAPLQWRLNRICRRENIAKNEAAKRIEEVEKTRDYLLRTYWQANPKQPAYNITIDNSVFSAEQAAELIILAATQLGLIPTK